MRMLLSNLRAAVAVVVVVTVFGILNPGADAVFTLTTSLYHEPESQWMSFLAGRIWEMISTIFSPSGQKEEDGAGQHFQNCTHHHPNLTIASMNKTLQVCLTDQSRLRHELSGTVSDGEKEVAHLNGQILEAGRILQESAEELEQSRQTNKELEERITQLEKVLEDSSAQQDCQCVEKDEEINKLRKELKDVRLQLLPPIAQTEGQNVDNSTVKIENNLNPKLDKNSNFIHFINNLLLIGDVWPCFLIILIILIIIFKYISAQRNNPVSTTSGAQINYSVIQNQYTVRQAANSNPQPPSSSPKIIHWASNSTSNSANFWQNDATTASGRAKDLESKIDDILSHFKDFDSDENYQKLLTAISPTLQDAPPMSPGVLFILSKLHHHHHHPVNQRNQQQPAEEAKNFVLALGRAVNQLFHCRNNPNQPPCEPEIVDFDCHGGDGGKELARRVKNYLQTTEGKAIIFYNVNKIRDDSLLKDLHAFCNTTNAFDRRAIYIFFSTESLIGVDRQNVSGKTVFSDQVVKSHLDRAWNFYPKENRQPLIGRVNANSIIL